MPVSNSTTPSPALTAHALQWGTPGQGSGRRRRYTPASTRSPRPSSRLRCVLRAPEPRGRSLACATRRRLDYVSRAASKGEPMSDEEAGGSAAKVPEAAANVQQVTKRRRRISGNEVEAVVRRYFEAIGARELDAAVAMWAEGGRENVRGQVDVTAPEGVRSFIR